MIRKSRLFNWSWKRAARDCPRPQVALLELSADMKSTKKRQQRNTGYIDILYPLQRIENYKFLGTWWKFHMDSLGSHYPFINYFWAGVLTRPKSGPARLLFGLAEAMDGHLSRDVSEVADVSRRWIQQKYTILGGSINGRTPKWMVYQGKCN